MEYFQELIANRKWNELREAIANEHPSDIADIVLMIDSKHQAAFFSSLPSPISSSVFTLLPPEQRNAILIKLADKEIRYLLAHIPPDDRTGIFEDLTDNALHKLLSLLGSKDKEEALELLGYPEGSVGRRMTPDYVAVRPTWTAQQSLKHIKQVAKRSETIHLLYVTSSSGALLGVVDIRTLILAKETQTMREIMEESVISISAFEKQEEAVRLMRQYSFFALPVVDHRRTLLGIITMDDVLDVAEEETSEDFQKTSAISPTLKGTYASSSVWSLYNRRILWLIMLVFINLVSSSIIATYEETLEAAIALAFFIPLLIDSGGNAGAQSATLMIRAIATGDVQMNEWLKTFSKEIMIGAILGLTAGLASMTLGFLRGGWPIAIIVGLSMTTIILVANLIGALLPFVLTKFKTDPAVASGPLITSVADAAGLFIYFSIATTVLGTTG